MLQAERAAKEKLAAEVVSLKSQVSDLSLLASQFWNAPTEAPHSFSPVLSTNKWMRRASPVGCGRRRQSWGPPRSPSDGSVSCGPARAASNRAGL